VEHDNSKNNYKNKKTLIHDYELMDGQKATVKKKQPSTLWRSMLISDFLNKKREKGKTVIEEENELEQAEKSLNEEVQEDQSVNEEVNHEITIEQGYNFHVYILQTY